MLSQYKLVQLYTDSIPKKFGETTSVQENKKFQRDTFGDSRLPLYVILEPSGSGKFREVARYDEGKINNEGAFIEFLRAPLKGLQPNGKVAAGAGAPANGKP